MDRDPIDALIDEAARGLTAGEPSPALRERVRERIAHPPRWWQRPVWQPALGAAAVAVVAAVVLWPGDEAVVPPAGPRVVEPASAASVTPTPVSPTPVSPPPVSPALSPQAAMGSRPVPVAPLPPTTTPQRPATPRPQAPLTAIADDMEPLLLTALDIAPLTMTAISTAPDVPMPLRIEGLSINPLTLEE